MSELDVQVFPDSGIWRKPPRAVRIDMVLQGSDGGSGSDGHPGSAGEVTTCSFPADEWSDTVTVTVGKGGLRSGADGYAIIVTELEDEE